MSNKTNFKLTKIYSDGSSEAPMLYKVTDLPDDWKFDRRSLISFAGLIAGSFVTLPSIGKSLNSGKTSENRLSDECNGIKAHIGSIVKICFSPNSHILITTSTDKMLKIWQIPSFELLSSLEQKMSIDSFSFEKSNSIISICNEKNVSFFNINTKKDDNIIPIRNILVVDYSLDGSHLALLSKSGNISLLNNKFEKTGDIETNFSSKFPIAYNIKSNYLVTSNLQNDILLYSIDFCNEYIVQQNNHIVISKLGKYMLSFTSDYSIKSWELPIGNLVKSSKCNDKISTVEISINGDYVVAGTLSGKIHVYSTINDFNKTLSHDDKIAALSFSPDNNYLASASDDGVIKLWEMPTFNHITCLFDKSILSKNEKVNQYTVKNKSGETITFTLPCGTPIPPGATCVCDCVPGSACSCVGHHSCSCVGYNSGSYCQCNQICTCVPIK
jgi:WD40 repeat protein